MATETLDLSSLTAVQGIKIKGLNSATPQNTPYGPYVARIGDINKDGYPDIAVSYPGSVCVIFGNGSFPSTIYVPVSAPYGSTLIGISGSTGDSVDGADDVNGDGYSDFLVSDPYAPNNLGTVWLIYGNSSFPSSIDLSNLGNLGVTITGNKNAFGRWVSGVGDSNKDGLKDFIIGNPYYPSGSGPGASFLIYGSSSLPQTIAWSDIPNYGVSIYGGGSITSGSALSGKIDFNKDGFDDILMGSYGGNGYVVIIYGNYSIPSVITLSNSGEAGIFSVIEGIFGSSFGISVSGADDMNQDSYGDFIVGANKANTVYIIYGNATFPTFTIITNINIQITTITGTSGSIGYSVGRAGDITQDGYPDALVGAPDANSNSGIVYIIYGNSSIPATMEFSNLEERGLEITGVNSGYTGISVNGGGDINQDGYDDTLVGAYGAKEAFVIYGAASGFATSSPTSMPSRAPSGKPSFLPTTQPSPGPTWQPSSYPSAQPTSDPSGQPSSYPTAQPSSDPSGQPSSYPSAQPTSEPSGQPSSAPTDSPASNSGLSLGAIIGIVAGGFTFLVCVYCAFARINHWWPFSSTINKAGEFDAKIAGVEINNPMADSVTKVVTIVGDVENPHTE